MMIENYRTQLIWRLMRDCPYSRPVCGAPDSAAAGCSGSLHPRITTMPEHNAPITTLAQDAYERERLDNVHPAGWRNPHPRTATIWSSSAPARPDWSRRAPRRPGREGRADRAHPARRRLPQCRLRAVESDHPHGAAVRRDARRRAFWRPDARPMSASIFPRDAAHAADPRPHQPRRFGASASRRPAWMCSSARRDSPDPTR